MLKIASKPHAPVVQRAAVEVATRMMQWRVVVWRFDSEHDVVMLANARRYGLAAYFYTEDVARVRRVADAPQSDLVGINEGASAAEAAPFGDVKESGHGRGGSRYGLRNYKKTTSTSINAGL